MDYSFVNICSKTNISHPALWVPDPKAKFRNCQKIVYGQVYETFC